MVIKEAELSIKSTQKKTQFMEKISLKKVSSKHSSQTLFHLTKDIKSDQVENRSSLLSCDQLNDFVVNIAHQLANKQFCQDYLRHVKTVTSTFFLQKKTNLKCTRFNSLPNKNSEV